MAHWIDDVYDLCEIVMDELGETKDKLKGGKMSAGDLEVIDKLAHTAKSLKTIIAMEDSEYSEQGNGQGGGGGQSGARGGRGGNRGGGGGRSREGRSRESYEDGMSNARRRDGMGRYSRDGFMDKLMEMRETAPNEKSRRAIEKMIDELEN